MSLTQRRRIPRDPDKFPAAQRFILALVRVAEPIALASIFPYAWKLVLQFHVCDESHASFYAGLLISAFSLAESLTGMYWGGLSDRIGRKPVLLFGCAGTILSLLLVGFARNFWVALIGRALGGFLNGNAGVVQTMVGELVTKREHEPRAYAVMPFMWSLGTILAPAIGGSFAEPSKSFPSIFPSRGLFTTFPYLLPNLICAALLLIAIIIGSLFLEETHPDMQPWSTQADLESTSAHTPMMPASAATSHAAADLTAESYGTFNEVDVHEDEEWDVRCDERSPSLSSAVKHKVFTKRVIMLVFALAIFTYHSMTYDHLLPIFLQDERGGDTLTSSLTERLTRGLGLSIQQVGVIMTFNGVIALFSQAVIFPLMASWLGVWRVFFIVTVGHPLAYIIVPYLTVLPENLLYVGIYGCLAVRNFFSILAYPLILILIKEAAPDPSTLGRINGLASSIAAASRTVASPIAGLLYGVGIQLGCTAIAWWASAFVAFIGGLQLLFIDRQKKVHSHVRAAGPCRLLTQAHVEEKNEVVHIIVRD